MSAFLPFAAPDREEMLVEWRAILSAEGLEADDLAERVVLWAATMEWAAWRRWGQSHPSYPYHASTPGEGPLCRARISGLSTRGKSYAMLPDESVRCSHCYRAMIRRVREMHAADMTERCR